MPAVKARGTLIVFVAGMAIRLAYDLAQLGSFSPLDGGFDITVWLVDGHKNVVGIVLTERAQIR